MSRCVVTSTVTAKTSANGTQNADTSIIAIDSKARESNELFLRCLGLEPSEMGQGHSDEHAARNVSTGLHLHGLRVTAGAYSLQNN